MSRLTIDISDQQHSSLKAVAALQGKSIRQYAIERLFPDAANQDDEAWEEFKTLIQGRVASGLAGNVSARTIREIADQALQQRRNS